MKKFHISIAVKNLDESIKDYSQKLGCEPCVVIEERYALWRNDILNFSISQKPEIAGQVRHIGFENSDVQNFTETHDCNGLMWEEFTAEMQMQEIKEKFGV
jgi:hypothetical protein